VTVDTKRPGTITDPALVIFDFDGVVADSEVISLATLADALRKYDIDLTLAEVRRRFLGKSIDKIIAEVRGQSAEVQWDGFVPHWHGILFARFAKDLTPVPGVVNLLDRLDAAGLPYCIASSSGFERIRFALDVMGLSPRFSHVFSAQEVRRGKPAPDLFLHAASQMGETPDRCLVIEDSPYGIQAARSAGMRAIGFLGGAHLSDIQVDHQTLLLAQGAHTVLHDLDKVTVQNLLKILTQVP